MDITFPDFKPFTTKVIFYRIPKNASTSIYSHLGNSNERVDQNIYKNIFDASHLKPKELRGLILGDCVSEYFSFCVVRNPWDRALSMYKHAILNKLSNVYGITEELTFDLFCNTLKENKKNELFIGSSNQVEWIDAKNPPKKILRFERVQEGFSEMVNDLNLIGVDPNLPHMNKTKHKHYSSYYNSETKKIIADIFQEDIDTFEYSFENASKPEGSLVI